MSTVRKHMLNGISYHFAVRERTDPGLNELGKSRKFSAVQVGTEDGYEDVHTFSRHPTFEEANEAAIVAENEFLAEYREDLGS